MKFCLILLAGWLGAIGLPTAEAAVLINGQNYVAVTNWAALNGLKSTWVSRTTLQAANKQDRLRFTVNSNEAVINGVLVILSHPVANDKGTLLVSQFDLDKTIRPLLYPAAFAARKPVKTICLDPGHGGKDPGFRFGWNAEKICTLLLADELAAQLRAAGFKVIFTRAQDAFVELPLRPDLANQRGADLFISLHFNATENNRAQVSGAETYCITPVGASSSNAEGAGAGSGGTRANLVEKNSLLLAYQVQTALVKNLQAGDRGVKRARFAVLRDAKMPAILVESGFLSHPAESRKITTAAYRRQVAAAILKGILDYQRLTAPWPPDTATEGTTGAKKKPRT